MLHVCLCGQVHVDEDRYERYSKLGDMLDFVTTDGHTTQLHACKQPVSSIQTCSSLLESGLGLKSGLKSIFAGLGLGHGLGL